MELPFANHEMQYFLSFQGFSPNKELSFKINKLLSDAWQISSITLNINDALVWADDFKFPRMSVREIYET